MNKNHTATTSAPDMAAFIDSPLTQAAGISTGAAAPFGDMIGASPVMQHLYDQMMRIARSHAPVFIRGEAGTGKDMCAQMLHKQGRNNAHPFIAIPSAVLAQHEAELTQITSGTLYLEDIGALNAEAQNWLLHFMDQTQLRIICSSSCILDAALAEGRFREDLYYRLYVLPLLVPPLRMRGDDIIALAYKMLQLCAQEDQRICRGFTRDAEALLRQYGWPGNIRQLKNIIRQVLVLSDEEMISAHILHPLLSERYVHGADEPGYSADTNSIKPLADIERAAIERAIALCNGHIPRAAHCLGLSPSTLYRKKAQWD